MENDNVALRLKSLIEKLGVTSSSFADKCGISRATLSQMLTGRNKKISDVILSQIHVAYPSISIMWLLFGEGPEWTDLQHDPEPSEPSSQTRIEDISERSEDFASSPDSENRFYPGSTTHETFQSNLSGVNPAENPTKDSEDQSVKGYQKTIEILSEIEKNTQKQRKVTQITIYYDDSTYETLFPQR